MPTLSPDQMEHIQSFSGHEGFFPKLEEETELARLAGLGDAEGFAAAMERMPGANPALAVSWASENGASDCLRMALARFETGCFHPFATALAAQHGRLECLRELISGGGDDAGFADALRAACAGGHPDCVQAMIDAPGGIDPDLDQAPSADPEGLGSQNALDWCIQSGSEECGRMLLGHIASAHPAHALGLSARYGRLDLLAPLLALASGADDLSEALYEACAHGHADCARLLLPLADPARDGANLSYAAGNGHADCVELLLPRADPGQHDFDALKRACSRGSADCARLLLDACPPPERMAWELLSSAIGSGSPAAAHLLASRLGTEIRGPRGQTPIMEAIEMTDGEFGKPRPDGTCEGLEVIEALVEAGADLVGSGDMEHALEQCGPALVAAMRAMQARHEARLIAQAARPAPALAASKARI